MQEPKLTPASLLHSYLHIVFCTIIARWVADGNRTVLGKPRRNACTFSSDAAHLLTGAIWILEEVSLAVLLWDFDVVFCNLKLYICRIQETKLIFSGCSSVFSSTVPFGLDLQFLEISFAEIMMLLMTTSFHRQVCQLLNFVQDFMISDEIQ